MTTNRKDYRRQGSSPFLRKPVPQPNNSQEIPRDSYGSIPASEGQQQELERHLSLIDLIAIGVGGTVGSGFFVLSGLVSNQQAGPAAVISWLISGCAACISGCCYAELSARIPEAGSAYAYAYIAMGELPALIAAACLTLEYIAAAAAVSRSWGDKVLLWLQEQFPENTILNERMSEDDILSPFAFLVSGTCVLLLLAGVKESKQATNFFTMIKIFLVSFMVLAGFYYTRPSNWTPFIPAEFGVSGVLRGASSTYLGYLGYDQVCCIAGEAQNPKKNLPRAILWVLAFVTLLYMSGTLALNGMQSYTQISPISGFPSAFFASNAYFAGEITAIGEIVTLPIVVLICIMAQPRLQYALSLDGLIPRWFGQVDESGNLHNGTVACGVLMVSIALCVPFTRLNDMISSAVLCALSMTDSSLILLWHECPENPESRSTEYFVLAYHVAALLTSIVLAKFVDTTIGRFVSCVGVLLMIGIAIAIDKRFPRAKVFGGHRQNGKLEALGSSDDEYFRTPLVPYWPCVGIFINWYLIAQLDTLGIALLLGYLSLAMVYYFNYAQYHSVGNLSGWMEDVDPMHSPKRTDSYSSDERSSLQMQKTERQVSLPTTLNV